MAEDGGGKEVASGRRSRPNGGGPKSSSEDGGGGKKHGGGLGGTIMCTLRKLTPPKLSIHRSSSSGHHQSSKEGGSRKASRAEAAATNGIGDDPAASSEAASARPVDPLGSQFFCPALNCYQKLRMEDVLVHAQEDHSLVLSDSPDRHRNSIEVSAADMAPGEYSAAWAPTLLTAFGTSFFFETWRNANGRWFMWVYHLARPGDGDGGDGGFLADLEIAREDAGLRLAYSGPVHSLMVPQTKITTSGRCLSFCDGLARALLQPLEPDPHDLQGQCQTGICYSVRVRRRASNNNCGDEGEDGDDVTEF